MDNSWFEFGTGAVSPRSNVLRKTTLPMEDHGGMSDLMQNLIKELSIVLDDSGAIPPILKLYSDVKALCVAGESSDLYRQVVELLTRFFERSSPVELLLKDINQNTCSKLETGFDLEHLFNGFNQDSFEACCSVLKAFLDLFNYVFARVNIVTLILSYLDRNYLVCSNTKLTIVELANALFHHRLFSCDAGSIVQRNLMILLHFNRVYQLNKYLASQHLEPMLVNSVISINNTDGIEPDKLLLNCMVIFKKMDLIVSNIRFYKNLPIKPPVKPKTNYNRWYLNELNRFTDYITEKSLLDKKKPTAIVSQFMELFEKIYQHEMVLARLVYNNKDTKQELKVYNGSMSISKEGIYFQHLSQYFHYAIFALRANFTTDDNQKFIQLVEKILLYKLIINNDASIPVVFSLLVEGLKYEELAKLYKFHWDSDHIRAHVDKESLSIVEDTERNELESDENELEADENEWVTDENEWVADENESNEKEVEEESSSDDDVEFVSPEPHYDSKCITSLANIWFNTVYNQLFTIFVSYKRKNNKKDKDKLVNVTTLKHLRNLDIPFEFELNPNTPVIIESLYNLKDKYMKIIEQSFQNNKLFIKKVHSAFLKMFTINNHELIIELVKYCDLTINTIYMEYLTCPLPFIQLINNTLSSYIIPQFELVYWFFLKFYKSKFEFFISYYRIYLSRRLLNMQNILDATSLHQKILIEKVFLILFTKDFTTGQSQDVYDRYRQWEERIKGHHIMDQLDINSIIKLHDPLGQQDSKDSNEPCLADDDEDGSFDTEELMAKFHGVHSMITDIETSQSYEAEFSRHLEGHLPKAHFNPLILNSKSWPNFSNNSFDLSFPDDLSSNGLLQLFDAFNEMFFLQSNKVVSLGNTNSSHNYYNKLFLNNNHKLLNWNFALHYLVLDFHLSDTQTITINTLFIIGCVLLCFNESEEWSYAGLLQKLKLNKMKSKDNGGANDETNNKTTAVSENHCHFNNNVMNSKMVSEKIKIWNSFKTNDHSLIRKSKNSLSTEKLTDSNPPSLQDPDDLVKRSLFSLQKAGLLIKQGSSKSVSGRFSLKDCFAINETVAVSEEPLKINLVSRKAVGKQGSS